MILAGVLTTSCIIIYKYRQSNPRKFKSRWHSSPCTVLPLNPVATLYVVEVSVLAHDGKNDVSPDVPGSIPYWSIVVGSIDGPVGNKSSIFGVEYDGYEYYPCVTRSASDETVRRANDLDLTDKKMFDDAIERYVSSGRVPEEEDDIP